MMVNACAKDMVASIYQSGYDFFTSVPCGILGPIIEMIDILAVENSMPHVLAPREDISLGVACGAYLSGRQPIALMQNSGLGQSVNAIASLIRPFCIPLTMIISVRGYKGEDTEENLVMGEITEKLLCDIGVPTSFLTGKNAEESVCWARSINQLGKPAAILAVPGAFGKYP